MLLTDRYQEKIRGIISCYDRVIIQGTLPNLCFAQGMTAFLTKRGIRIFDYPRFAEPLRDTLRANAERLARLSARLGACAVGHGGLRFVQALAR